MSGDVAVKRAPRRARDPLLRLDRRLRARLEDLCRLRGMRRDRVLSIVVGWGVEAYDAAYIGALHAARDHRRGTRHA